MKNMTHTPFIVIAAASLLLLVIAGAMAINGLPDGAGFAEMFTASSAAGAPYFVTLVIAFVADEFMKKL